MTRCLVTGGAGFIGSHLVDALLAAGHDVRVLDNFSTGDRRNLMAVAGDIEVVEGDLRSYERAFTATRGCEVVFHQAALPSVPRSVADPLTTSAVNVTGTLNVLLAARDAGTRRVVYASSSSVYGSNSTDVKREDLPVNPLSPYGVSKHAAEGYCVSFSRVYGLESVSLRYFNVFGPRQNPISEYAAVIPNVFSAALLGEDAIVFGDGNQCRDFTFVDDVVAAALIAAEAPEASGEVFNIGRGERTSVNGLIGLVSEITGKPIALRYLPWRPGETRVSVADITKAVSILGYRPRVSVKEGLARVYEDLLADASLVSRIHERRKWVTMREPE
jgi:UDP-glucose 4-epimerase